MQFFTSAIRFHEIHTSMNDEIPFKNTNKKKNENENN